MNESSFVEKREADWRQIAYLSDRADVSPSQLSEDELHEFIRLYRRASGDLALARTKSSNVPLISFLNDLVGRAYGILYRAKRKSVGAAIADGIAIAAQTARRRKAFLIASAMIFIGTGALTFGTLGARPDLRDHMVNDPMMKMVFEQWKKGEFPKTDASNRFAMTSFYMSNNPLVAIVAGSIAASTFGVGTVLQLARNGLLIGSLSFEMARVGKLGFLYASILPHGVPELSGLVVSGAAGLLMGWALINPGRRTRGEALREAGKDAVVLLATSVCLMFIAAPIEGFFSFNPDVPSAYKVAVILGELVVWGLFWTGFGKSSEEMAAASDLDEIQRK